MSLLGRHTSRIAGINDAPLSDVQRAVLAFATDRVAAGGEFPSAREIADHMQWDTATKAVECLRRLCVRGHLRIVDRRTAPRFVLARAPHRPESP